MGEETVNALAGVSLTIARGGELVASDGSALRLHANTLCVHGDNASSVAAVQSIRQAFDSLVQA